MDAERLRKKAIEKGVLNPNQKLSDDQAYQLIFAPGFSTKAEVTDVSGRGVGMDVVKTNIEKLQGEILIETTLGKGSCFTIRLPLTLAIIEGMTVQLANERYVVPLSHVHESVRPTASDVKFTSGAGEILLLRGENLPLYRLSALLQKPAEKPTEDCIAIVVRLGKQPFAVLVDDILGHQQVVIKKLGNEVQSLRGFSGSAILGDGRPALILEFAELVNRSRPLERQRSA
jgi:two-component system chemotaxis sensor kinase CheA